MFEESLTSVSLLGDLTSNWGLQLWFGPDFQGEVFLKKLRITLSFTVNTNQSSQNNLVKFNALD